MTTEIIDAPLGSVEEGILIEVDKAREIVKELQRHLDECKGFGSLSTSLENAIADLKMIADEDELWAIRLLEQRNFV